MTDNLSTVELRVARAAFDVAPADRYTAFMAPDLYHEQLASWRKPGPPRCAGLKVEVDRRLSDNQIRLRHEVSA